MPFVQRYSWCNILADAERNKIVFYSLFYQHKSFRVPIVYISLLFCLFTKRCAVPG